MNSTQTKHGNRWADRCPGVAGLLRIALLILAGIVAGESQAFAQNMTTFTKSFGAAIIPLNGTTSLTFDLTDVSGTAPDSFTDTLPAGLVVATPNGLSAVTGTCGTITAAVGSPTVNMSVIPFSPGQSCSFSVNVTGTTPGVKNNSVTDAFTPSSTANASVTVLDVTPVTLQSFDVQ